MELKTVKNPRPANNDDHSNAVGVLFETIWYLR
jgi:hypothetical protein